MDRFLLQPNSKLPQVKDFNNPANYPRYTEVSKDIGGNYGVPCGEINNIVVCDYDLYKTDFKITIEDIKKKHGDTLIVATPSGGYHAYNKYEEKHHNWKGITGLLDGVLDIRTQGNYVVGWGSTTEKGEYRIVSGSYEGITTMPEETYNEINALMTPKKIHEYIDCEEYTHLLEEIGFTGIKWKNDYGFDCDQRGKGAKCPLCGQEHRSNHFYIYKDDMECVWVRNFSAKCNRRKIKSEFMFREDEAQLAKLDPDFTEEYFGMKRKFEETTCRIVDKLLYVVQENNDTLNYLNVGMLRERFLSLRLTNDKGKKTPFIEAWLKDPFKRDYQSLDFLPNNINPKIFNTWRGYAVASLTGGGDPSPFFELVEDLTGGETDYFLKWLAHLFQHPEQKPITAPVFYSQQGCGKNTLMDFIGTLMGNELYYTTDNVEQDIFGRFSTALENRKLVVIDEADSRNMAKENGRLKGLITNKITKVERKGVQSIDIKNLAGLVFCSNEDKPVKIEDSDRRYILYTSSQKLRGNQEFFNMFLNEWSIKPENQRAVYDYLMALDISQVNWIADRPITEAYRDIRMSCLPWDIKWVDNLICSFPKEWEGKKVSVGDLCDNYNAFTPNGFENKNTNSMGILLKNLQNKKKLVGFDKQPRGKHGWTYIIDRVVVFLWLQLNEYTEETSLPEPVELEFSNNF